MKKLLLISLLFTLFKQSFAQPMTDSARNFKRDSSLRAMYTADSAKIAKQFAEIEKWDKIKARAQYPLLKGSDFSGIIPVDNVTEKPDPNQEYKLLFELTDDNPDSTKNESDNGLNEVIRVINLHVASGIPASMIKPVIVIHGSALSAVSNNVYYQKHYKKDNANIKLVNDLKGVGAKFIICGQAMTFHSMTISDFLPDIKLSLTAQTVLSNYQLKGYVLYAGGGK